MRYRLEKPGSADIDALALALRQADRDEIDAMSGLPHREAIRASVAASQEAWAGYAGDEILVIFGRGRASMLSDHAVVWALTSTAVERHRVAFLRAARRVLRLWAHDGDLSNYVDDRNTEARRWLRWAGAEFLPPVRLGPKRYLFHPFLIRRAT